MNAKITFQELSVMLAESSGLPRKMSEDFLREFTVLVTETLSAGESVKIKGFGTFKLVEIEERKSVNVATGREMTIPVHLRVTFVPSKELAMSVNSPFSAFETVEIDDEISDSEIESVSSEEMIRNNEESNSDEKESGYRETDGYSIQDKTPDLEDRSEQKGPEPDHVASDYDSSEYHPTFESYLDDEDDVDGPDDMENVSNKDGKRFGQGFVIGSLFTLVIVGIIYFVMFGDLEKGSIKQERVTKREVTKTDTISKEISDTVLNEGKTAEGTLTVDTRPSDEVIYDTISTTRFLTTMAKQHYGNYHLWPYIYEENKAILGHPDRIRPGTKVVIPSLSKYGVDAGNKDDIEKAKRLGAEIYARYN